MVVEEAGVVVEIVELTVTTVYQKDISIYNHEDISGSSQ